MKSYIFILVSLLSGIVSCVDKSKGSGYLHDTLVKGSIDTVGQQVIPGTSGASGTEISSKDSITGSDSLIKKKDSIKN